MTDRPSRELSLEDRYDLLDGRVFLSGPQALVRAILDQRRADDRAGRRTGAFVSGYPGSPMAVFDRELARNRKRLRDNHVVHQPGLNEELGATSVWGSQLANLVPGPRYEGVTGVWYGKAPGLDRSGDAMRHANYGGTHPLGGVLVACGEDPACKSSTVPSVVEGTLADMLMPTFAPGTVQEMLELGLHAIACSRVSGTWSGMKLPTNVVDGAGTVTVHPELVVPRLPSREYQGRPYRHEPRADLTQPVVLEAERTLFEVRLPLAADYATLNGVNRVSVSGPDDWLGIVAAGKTYVELHQALADLGLDERELERLGIRLLKLGMVFPLDVELIQTFAQGLTEVLVLEDKLPFLETRVRDALYGSASQPHVLGKRDPDGRPLLSSSGELLADDLARAIAARLAQKASVESVEARIAALDARAEQVAALPAPAINRTPFFCSGCPHNSSTVAGEDAVVGVGIGCHSMVLLAPEGKGQMAGLTQMGGEGAQWIGMAPFTETGHFVQNLGDGTFHHSGSLAVRAAVAAGASVTFKLLYNRAVAMTGGQHVEGVMPVDKLTRWLELEGVARTIVTTEDPSRYDSVTLAGNAELRGRDGLMAAQRELAAVEGVTVLIHDQECAAEKRRKRKRGLEPEADVRVHINERVCEGCGDCGRKSSCLSVQPVETEFGRKTQIHQASCNADYSCLKGDCPSFLTIVGGSGPVQRATHPAVPVELADPELVVRADDFTVRMLGIGGTGVVTVSQILGVAALIDGREVTALDQTGLSQKGGPVTSDVRITATAFDRSNRVGAGRADLLLGFDLLGAGTPANLATADPARTVAVLSTSAVPTGEMVVDGGARFPQLDRVLDAVERVTRPDLNHYLDAQALSLALFDDHMPANLVLLGAAYQRGALPVSGDAIEQAIRLNGTGVETNLLAFAWGRASVVAPDAVAAVTPAVAEDERDAGPDTLDELIERRARDLADYQDAAYAGRYRSFVAEVRQGEDAAVPGATAVTDAVARNLYKLMAYKDEYEVARLHLDEAERARVSDTFGPDAKVSYNLHPPMLRALGYDRKIRVGEWFEPAFRTLRRARRLRGTRLDVFGYAEVRKVERALIEEYREDVRAALGQLDAGNHERVAELAALPDLIRGYEDVKLGNVTVYRQSMRAARERLRTAPPTVVHR